MTLPFPNDRWGVFDFCTRKLKTTALSYDMGFDMCITCYLTYGKSYYVAPLP